MLVALRSFSYSDPYLGRQRVIAGKTRISPDHWLATTHPTAWRVSEARDEVRTSRPIPLTLR